MLNTYVDYEMNDEGTVAPVLYALYTFGYPMSFDDNGYVASMMNVDIDCGKWMGKFVADLNIPATHTTVVDPERLTVLASSFPSLSPGYRRPNISDVDTYEMWGMQDLPEPRLAAAISALGSIGAIETLPYRTMILEPSGSDDIISARPIRLAGLNLLIIGVTESDYYYAKGERASRDASITSAGLLVAAIIVAIVTAVLLSRPLSDLGRRMARTASLEEDDGEVPTSLVTEISSMQKSYTTMKKELYRMKAYLPQSLLVSTEEDDEGDVDFENATEGNGSKASRESCANSRRSGTQNSRSASVRSAPTSHTSSTATGHVSGPKDAEIGKREADCRGDLQHD